MNVLVPTWLKLLIYPRPIKLLKCTYSIDILRFINIGKALGPLNATTGSDDFRRIAQQVSLILL